ncbi:MAG TPA: hypothetical protein PKO34_05975 [Smithellaceae bacterium]|nr:hypothetical protein [Smithellaceae bacterium]
MSDFLEYICSWSALKWVVIVLIASFIGQFGKMLAQVIVKKISLVRQKKQVEPIMKPLAIRKDHEAPAVDKQQDVIETQERDVDKKALKIAAKERKKISKKSK